MTIVDDRLGDVCTQVGAAADAVGADSGASAVLAAVIGEFRKKSDRARDGLGGEAAALRDLVLDMEQAGDSAKAAAEADTGLTDATRQLVLDAHLAICKLKFKAYGTPTAS